MFGYSGGVRKKRTSYNTLRQETSLRFHTQVRLALPADLNVRAELHSAEFRKLLETHCFGLASSVYRLTVTHLVFFIALTFGMRQYVLCSL